MHSKQNIKLKRRVWTLRRRSYKRASYKCRTSKRRYVTERHLTYQPHKTAGNGDKSTRPYCVTEGSISAIYMAL